ncbi:hypothetical protein [Elioraea sp.]|jgi:hypothetical protein
MENPKTRRERRTTDDVHDREQSILVGLVILLSIVVILLAFAWLLIR